METADDNAVNYHIVFKWRPFIRQFFVSSVIWTTFFILGLSMGVAPVTIPQLKEEANSTAIITDEMISWITSVSAYVGVPLIPCLGVMAHYYGRMKTILMVSIMGLLSSIVLYFSRNATHVLISQALQGGPNAAVTTTTLLVVTECSSPRYRGIFLTIKSATLYWGIWVANAIGVFYDYRNIGLLGILCSIYNIISLCFIPESPLWLAGREMYEKCTKSHRWLYGTDVCVERELETLINTQRQTKNEISEHFNLLRGIVKPEIHKPVLISCLLMAAYHSFGKFVCTMYSIQMIKAITNSGTTAYIGMLILDGFTVLGMYVGCGLSKVFKRRMLLLSTSAIGIIFLYTISLYLYLIQFSVISENNYITISLLTGYSLAVCGGPIILVTSIVAELVPVRLRILSSILFAFFSLFLQGTMLKVSPYIFKSFGFKGTFLCFAIMATLATIAVYYFLPETKDKTLHEIENLFKRGREALPAEVELLTNNDKTPKIDELNK